MSVCPHGLTMSEQGGVTQMDIDACEGKEADETYLLRFYSACDCCDTLMHHSTIGFGYKVMRDGRTLCGQCVATEAPGDIDE